MPGNDEFTSLLMSFNCPNGDGSTIWRSDRARGDVWTGGVTFTPTGTPRIDTAQFKWGTSSLRLDGTERLNLANLGSANIISDLWSSVYTDGNCTISMWVRHNTTSGIEHYIAFQEDATNRWYFRSEFGSQGLSFFLQESGAAHLAFAQGADTMVDDTWYHIAYIRTTGGHNGLYLNGVQVAYASWSGNEGFAEGDGFAIGDYAIGSGGSGVDGWIDDVVMAMDNIYGATPNVGVTDSFTPPTEQTLNDEFITLLMDMEGADESQEWETRAGISSNVTALGSPLQIAASPKKYGNCAIEFDFSPARALGLLDIGSWTGINMGSGPFTFDWWFRQDVPNADQGVLGWDNGINDFFHMWWDYSIGDGFYDFIVDFEVGGVGDTFIVADIDLPDADSLFHHFALIRGWGGDPDEWALCIDGVVQGTQTITAAMGQPGAGGGSQTGEIGRTPGLIKYAVGFMDELRISKGIARWTESPFTPPTGPYNSEAGRLSVIGGVPIDNVAEIEGVAIADAEEVIGESIKGDIR